MINEQNSRKKRKDTFGKKRNKRWDEEERTIKLRQ